MPKTTLKVNHPSEVIEHLSETLSKKEFIYYLQRLRSNGSNYCFAHSNKEKNQKK